MCKKLFQQNESIYSLANDFIYLLKAQKRELDLDEKAERIKQKICQMESYENDETLPMWLMWVKKFLKVFEEPSEDRIINWNHELTT